MTPVSDRPAHTYRLTLYTAGTSPSIEEVAERIRQWCAGHTIAREA